MALVTKVVFSEMCGMGTGNMANNKKRGKVVYEDNGLIDTCNSINKSFLVKHSSKAEKVKISKPEKVKQIPREETFIEPVESEDSDVNENGIPAIHISDARYKHALARKTEAGEELERLKIEKLKGDVIPTAPIETLIFQFKQYTLTQQKIANEAFLNEITHKYSITNADMAYYRGFFIKGLNNAVKAATSLFLKDLESTLQLYSVKK